MLLSLVVAADEHNCIGGKNTLLWHLPNDMKHFRECTKGKPIIMGRKTYDSIGRVLPGRRNIIISRQTDLKIAGADVVSSLDDALRLAATEKTNEICVIGGAEIYKQAIDRADKIYLTRVHGEFKGDAFFPEVDLSEWKEVARETHSQDSDHAYAYDFITYEHDDAGCGCGCEPEFDF